MITIMFDRSCIGWTKYPEFNRAFLTQQNCYILETLSRRGYMYLNEIYETLGAKWNPNDENICWHGRPIWFEFEPAEGSDFVVKIS